MKKTTLTASRNKWLECGQKKSFVFLADVSRVVGKGKKEKKIEKERVREGGERKKDRERERRLTRRDGNLCRAKRHDR